MTMRINNFKALLKAALRVVCILPLAAGVAFGQQVVNLTAGPTSVTLPDGSTVPMWGYSCGLPVTTNAAPTATCAALNPHAPAATATTPAGWSDRKSTRLNSSHMSISYAVFCLKKKKIQYTNRSDRTYKNRSGLQLVRRQLI